MNCNNDDMMLTNETKVNGSQWTRMSHNNFIHGHDAPYMAVTGQDDRQRGIA